MPNRVFATLAMFVIVFCGLSTDAAETSEPKKISFDDLKFEMKKGETFQRSMLGEKIEALDGRSVSIRGFMFPTFQAKGVKNFILMFDNQQMNFGAGFALNETILVEMTASQTTEFTNRPITVQGVFSIREHKVEGKVYGVYHVEGATVKPVSK